jgi:hypothetical protein
VSSVSDDFLIEVLLVRRAPAQAQPEHYVEWAARRLTAGDDTASLRILAGLSSRWDREEIAREQG